MPRSRYPKSEPVPTPPPPEVSVPAYLPGRQALPGVSAAPLSPPSEPVITPIPFRPLPAPPLPPLDVPPVMPSPFRPLTVLRNWLGLS